MRLPGWPLSLIDGEHLAHTTGEKLGRGFILGYFIGINFRGKKLSRSPRAKINFCGYKLSRMVPFRNFAGINFRDCMKFW